jgi:hypothetical protein
MQVNDIPLYFPENATYVRENLKRLQLRAFYLIKTFILNSISSKRIKELDTSVLKSVLKKSVQNARNSNDLPYTSSDFVSRKLFIDAITGLFCKFFLIFWASINNEETNHKKFSISTKIIASHHY